MFAAISCVRCCLADAIESSSWDNTKRRLRERGWKMNSQGEWLCSDCVRHYAERMANKLQRMELAHERKLEVALKSLPPNVTIPDVYKNNPHLCMECKEPMKLLKSGKHYCQFCKRWVTV